MSSYISASTNRHPHAADISSASLVAFASSNLVSLWDTARDRGVFVTLAAHEGLVTCVRFLTNELLATADDKGVLRCWRQTGSQWKSTAKAEAHAQAISSLCVHDKCMATGASDGTVKIWKIASDTDELREVQLLSLHGKYPLALTMTTLPQSKVEILAVAGTDRNIQIWTRSGDVFVRSAVLSGHEDWVRSLAFQDPATTEDPLTLASGSQDATIRLWKIETFTRHNSPRPSDTLSDDLLDAFEASLGDLADAEEGGRQISLKRHILTVKSDQASTQQYSITFDALLIGHEAGVTSLSWRPATLAARPTLLSTSTDSSLILWSPTAIRSSSEEDTTSIWISRQRFGDVGGQRLGGFVGGLWARNGNEALAWGWSGGWRRWRCTSTAEKNSEEVWGEVGAITGHSGPVKSLDWSPSGEYLISAGLDQTTRIHGPIRGHDGSSSWHELSRPQVHGYDVLGVSFLGPLKFVSIADEKVARVFEAPRGFVDSVEQLGIAVFTEEQHNRPVAASVPPLGLSNKAVNEAVVPATSGESDVLSRAPFEGELAATTLWPETEKIFGHGYESMSLAVSGSRRLIATACKASTAEHAVVRVYNTDNWQPVGEPLSGHTLTVTRIAFSPDDHLVLSVSRDRSWRLYEAQTDGAYLPVAADKSHGRIIWDCAWAAEGDIFATASRDKTVKIWQRGPGAKWTAAEVIKTKEAATAVDFSPLDSQNRRHLAIGLETGEILIYSNAAAATASWQLEHTFDSSAGHVGHVHGLSWRPTSRDGLKELASCSEDGTLRVRVTMGERYPNNYE